MTENIEHTPIVDGCLKITYPENDLNEKFTPCTYKLKILYGPRWSDDPFENKFINDMVNENDGVRP